MVLMGPVVSAVPAMSGENLGGSERLKASGVAGRTLWGLGAAVSAASAVDLRRLGVLWRMECGFDAVVSGWTLEVVWIEMVRKLHRVSIGQFSRAVTYSP